MQWKEFIHEKSSPGYIHQLKQILPLTNKKLEEKDAYLLPDISMSLMATAIQGNINKVVTQLIRKDAEVEPRPRFERRYPTPACSRICGV